MTCDDCRLSRALLLSMTAHGQLTLTQHDAAYAAISIQEHTMRHLHLIPTAGDIGEEQEETEVVPMPVEVPQPAPLEPVPA